MTRAEPSQPGDAAASSTATPTPANDSLVDETPAARGTRSILLLRHADAGDAAAWSGDDAGRPLSPRGRDQARLLARLLADAGRGPDVIVTSPKVRARETAEAVARQVGCGVVIDDALGGPFGLTELVGLIERHRRSHWIMLVGHDPDFSALASSLTGAPIALEKGALARVDLAAGAVEGASTLRWLIPPSILPG